MARPRIRQFAGDMGISYDEANNLIKKGRGRKDGGSQILESNMKKMRGTAQGGMTVEDGSQASRNARWTLVEPTQFMGSTCRRIAEDEAARSARLLDAGSSDEQK